MKNKVGVIECSTMSAFKRYMFQESDCARLQMNRPRQQPMYQGKDKNIINSLGQRSRAHLQ